MVVGLLKILELERSWRWMRGFQPLAAQLAGGAWQVGLGTVWYFI
jgi:hypothetical protein